MSYGTSFSNRSDSARARWRATSTCPLRIAVTRFGTTPEFWLHLQVAHDLEVARTANLAA
jgi:plasmid maintenance system antidote protein VapI